MKANPMKRDYVTGLVQGVAIGMWAAVFFVVALKYVF